MAALPNRDGLPYKTRLMSAPYMPAPPVVGRHVCDYERRAGNVTKSLWELIDIVRIVDAWGIARKDTGQSVVAENV